MQEEELEENHRQAEGEGGNPSEQGFGGGE